MCEQSLLRTSSPTFFLLITIAAFLRPSIFYTMIIIGLAVISYYLVGEGLRDALDPRLK